MGICCSGDIDHDYHRNCCGDTHCHDSSYIRDNRYDSILKDGYIVDHPTYNYCRYEGGMVKCCQDERCISNKVRYPQYQNVPLEQPPYKQPPYNPSSYPN